MNGFSFGMAVAREGSGFFVSLGWYKPWYKIILTPVQENTNPQVDEFRQPY